MRYAASDVYRGQFRSNKRDGHGRYEESNGAYYEGDWKEDVKEGKGEERRAD